MIDDTIGSPMAQSGLTLKNNPMLGRTCECVILSFTPLSLAVGG